MDMLNNDVIKNKIKQIEKCTNSQHTNINIYMKNIINIIRT